MQVTKLPLHFSGETLLYIIMKTHEVRKLDCGLKVTVKEISNFKVNIK